MLAQINKEYAVLRPKKVFDRLISNIFFEGKPLTAKARFINPFLFWFYRIIISLPKMKTVTKPIYIIGMGRSGTTILGRILSVHSDIGFLNEPKALWYAVNNKDDIIGNYSDKDGKYRLDKSNSSIKIKKGIEKLYAFYLGITFNKRVLDKYPEMIFRIDFIKEIFPEAKFIFIYRNGIDTAISSSNWSANHGKIRNSNEEYNWWGKNNKKWHLLIDQIVNKEDYFKNLKININENISHTDKSIIEWVATMQEGHKLKQKYGESLLTIRYEDFVNHPKKELENIFNFCELKADEKVIRYADKILKSMPEKSSIHINPKIKDAFINTMHLYGYN